MSISIIHFRVPNMPLLKEIQQTHSSKTYINVKDTFDLEKLKEI